MDKMTEPAVIILAAGSGGRFGMPKIMLHSSNGYALAVIAQRLERAGLTSVVCVTAPDVDPYDYGAPSWVEHAINQNPRAGMISSLATGMDALKGHASYIVAPVDHPFVTSATYRALAVASRLSPGCVCVPSMDGRTGHPIAVPAGLGLELPGHDVDGGLGAVITRSGLKRIDVPVHDEGVFRNVNTMEDWQSWAQ
jgi:CTP:molybdopterin cytidylyltransferase MocA